MDMNKIGLRLLESGSSVQTFAHSLEKTKTEG